MQMPNKLNVIYVFLEATTNSSLNIFLIKFSTFWKLSQTVSLIISNRARVWCCFPMLTSELWICCSTVTAGFVLSTVSNEDAERQHCVLPIIHYFPLFIRKIPRAPISDAQNRLEEAFRRCPVFTERQTGKYSSTDEGRGITPLIS